MEPQTPASLTTLFDLKVKQQVTNNTIFSNATQVFDHKLGNFRKCTLWISFHIHKKIGIEYFSGLLSNSIWGWGTHDWWFWKDQEFLHHSYLRRGRMQKRNNQPRNSKVPFTHLLIRKDRFYLISFCFSHQGCIYEVQCEVWRLFRRFPCQRAQIERSGMHESDLHPGHQKMPQRRPLFADVGQ